MSRFIAGGIFILFLTMLPSHAQATHIQYVSLANVSGAVISYDGEGDTVSSWSWTFDLLADEMFLWELLAPTDHPFDSTPDVETADYTGSYDPAAALHYVTLRIDPNRITGENTSTFIGLAINGIAIDNWENPIRLYNWGVPGDPVSDDYEIASNNYQIMVTLTGLESLLTDESPRFDSIPILNVNLEGCFDTASQVPEPTTILLLGTGLISLAGGARRKMKL